MAPGDGPGAPDEAGRPDRARLQGRRLLLGVCGGIAAYKAPLVVRLLAREGADVTAVLTGAARRFVGPATFAGLTGNRVPEGLWDQEGASHVELADDAEGVLVYPATAHLLARAAAGLADDLLTTTLLATTAPVVMAPAMHTGMWDHPATVDNVERLRERGVVLVGPEEGELMGGDRGEGRAVEPEAFVEAAAAALTVGGDLTGRRFVVTAGGTREPLDPVRFIGNRSSGRMGFAIAAAAARRGASVVLVAAPTQLATPAGVERRDVTTAAEMREIVLSAAEEADVVVKAAAVADFRPARQAGRKIKKDEQARKGGGSAGLTLELEPTADILGELGGWEDRGRPLLVGFAAETEDLEANGRRKLKAKGADLLVVNDVSRSGSGFESEDNEVIILGRGGGRVRIGLAAKRAVADRVLDEVVARLG